MDPLSIPGYIPDAPASQGGLGDFLSGFGGLLSGAADAYARVRTAGNSGQPENTYRTYGSTQSQELYGLGTPQPGTSGNGAVLWLVLGVVGAVVLLKFAKE